MPLEQDKSRAFPRKVQTTMMYLTPLQIDIVNDNSNGKMCLHPPNGIYLFIYFKENSSSSTKQL